jgi:hypothetical protein
MPLSPDTPKICSICRKTFEEFGESAWPVNNGRCCNVCNDLYVIPARIRQMRQEQKPEGQG